MRRWFLSHPDAAGESYGEHMRVAVWFGARLIAAGAACLVHAVIPCLFERTGSTAIRSLHRSLGARAAGRAEPTPR